MFSRETYEKYTMGDSRNPAVNVILGYATHVMGPLGTYARDYDSFIKAARLLEDGQWRELGEHIKSLDTDQRDGLMSILDIYDRGAFDTIFIDNGEEYYVHMELR